MTLLVTGAIESSSEIAAFAVARRGRSRGLLSRCLTQKVPIGRL